MQENTQTSKLDQAEQWDTHRSRLIGWLIKQGLNPADAEDLAQEILLKAWDKQDQLKNSSSLQAWLFGIARTTIIDHYRKKPIHVPNIFLEEGNDQQDITFDLEPCITPFIEDLSPAHQRILNAVDLKGVSQKEYAQQNGLAYSTAKSQLKRARHLLAQRYRKCCSFQHDSSGRIMEYERKAKPDCEC